MILINIKGRLRAKLRGLIRSTSVSFGALLQAFVARSLLSFLELHFKADLFSRSSPINVTLDGRDLSIRRWQLQCNRIAHRVKYFAAIGVNKWFYACCIERISCLVLSFNFLFWSNWLLRVCDVIEFCCLFFRFYQDRRNETLTTETMQSIVQDHLRRANFESFIPFYDQCVHHDSSRYKSPSLPHSSKPSLHHLLLNLLAPRTLLLIYSGHLSCCCKNSVSLINAK